MQWLRSVSLGWRLAAAGGIAGMITNCVLFPLDTVKTVRQANPKAYAGVLPTINSILRTKGFSGLYTGVSPALVGSALSSALYFGMYELMRRRLGVVESSYTGNTSKMLEQVGGGGARVSVNRLNRNALAAASGNIASSVLFVPKEVVKQRMQSGVDSGRFIGVALDLVRADGLSGLYRGYKATLLRNIPSTMLRFALYEEAKLLLQRTRRERTGPRGTTLKPAMTALEHVGCGAVAGSIASAITTPMDVIKTRYATGKVTPGIGLLGAAAEVVRDQGVRGLYVGIKPRLLWAALFAAVGFSSYEACKSVLVRDTGALTPTRTALAGRARGSPSHGSASS